MWSSSVFWICLVRLEDWGVEGGGAEAVWFSDGPHHHHDMTSCVLYLESLIMLQMALTHVLFCETVEPVVSCGVVVRSLWVFFRERGSGDFGPAFVF